MCLYSFVRSFVRSNYKIIDQTEPLLYRVSECIASVHRPWKQGELVDNVEHHVESSTDYIKQGHLELKQAEMYQSKARKVLSDPGFKLKI